MSKGIAYILCCVRHDTNIMKAFCIQSSSNCPNSAIHHITRANNISTCPSLTEEEIISPCKYKNIKYKIIVELRTSEYLRNSLFAQLMNCFIIHYNSYKKNQIDNQVSKLNWPYIHFRRHWENSTLSDKACNQTM